MTRMLRALAILLLALNASPSSAGGSLPRRVVEDPPTIQDAQLWLTQTLNPSESYCLDRIIWNESRWNPTSRNPSGAYGLPQSKPAEKMASAGSDWRWNPITQLRWSVNYGTARYGSMCQAWVFWLKHKYW